MSDIETQNRLTRLEIEQATLREKTNNFKDLITRFENTLDSVEDLIEHRRLNTNDDLKDIYEKISDLEESIKDSNKEINAKIESLNRWRWFVQGGMFIVGVVIAKLADWFSNS